MQTLAALNASLSKAPMPWHLDWSHLQAIDAAAVVPLSRLFAAWAAQPVQLRFVGCDRLDAVLLDRLHVLGHVAPREDAGHELGVHRLDAPVQDFG